MADVNRRRRNNPLATENYDDIFSSSMKDHRNYDIALYISIIVMSNIVSLGYSLVMNISFPIFVSLYSLVNIFIQVSSPYALA
jgi:hypothetical protein